MIANQNANTVSVLLGKPDGTFAAKADFAVGTSPSGLATGDFNGDGKLDLAVTNSSDGTVSVLLGNGDGTFQAQEPYPTGKSPSSVAVGDFNGDKKPDLAVANNRDNTVSILLGKGDGTFRTQVVYATGSASPSCVITADFNGDGKLDLVVAGAGASILLGNGDGSFQAAASIISGAGPESAAAGDLNGDGYPDLVITDSAASTATPLVNSGLGSFGPVGVYSTGTSPAAAGFVDLNNDGLLDIVTVNSSGSVSVLIQNTFNSGGVTYLNFAQHVDYAVTGSLFGLALGDFNGDGRADVAVANNTRNVASVFIGVGNGLLQIRTDLGVGDPRANSLVAGDFNGDGKADLIVPGVYFDYSPTTYLSNGDGTFAAVTATQTVLNGPSATGDFNDDGKLDLAMPTYGRIAVLPGNGDGTFGPGVTLGSASGPLLAGDFNGDGKLDLIYYDSATVLVLGNGDGTFGSPTTINSTLTPVLTADFNGDGKLDLILQSSQGALSILLGNGNGTFGSPSTVSATSGPTVSGDFNGDGKPDLAIFENGGVTVLLGNGDGTFQPGISTTASGSLIGVGDFNHDGISDLAVINAGTFEVLYGNGDGTFRIDTVGSAPTNSLAGVAAGDMNADGIQDLGVLTNGPAEPSQTLSVLIGQVVISLYPSTLTFPDTAVGSTSTLNVTVSNPAVGQLAISSVAVSSGFTQTNDCPQALPSGGSCTVTVSFTPTTAGTATGAVTVTDSSPTSPQTIALTGTVGPEISLTPGSLTFAGQVVSTTGAKQSITLTNTGSEPLIITSLTASGDFAETNTCGGSVAIGANCTISVTFTPTAGGTRTGAITINENAPGSPHQVSLTGIGQDFAIGISGTETVPAGQAAYYTLEIKPLGGFNQTVALSCSGLPQFASCIFSPASIAPANGPVGVSMKVTTKAPSQTSGSGAAPWRLPPLRPPLGPTKAPWLWLAALSAGTLAMAARRRRLALVSALILLSATMWVACGGGATPLISTPGTPAGTFTLTVNATSGPLAHAATTTLVVH